jgi:hypothetical protein
MTLKFADMMVLVLFQGTRMHVFNQALIGILFHHFWCAFYIRKRGIKRLVLHIVLVFYPGSRYTFLGAQCNVAGWAGRLKCMDTGLTFASLPLRNSLYLIGRLQVLARLGARNFKTDCSILEKSGFLF